ncbi:MAG: type VI secretion system baseplate subunit TssK [Campylobacter sp.]|nr:type VI secretion system baseplate subunit TssK [Campylobacter sp.]
MADSLKVVWYNGMNVDKIHFEQQERYFERNINLKTISSFANLYGILDIHISNELLEQGKIGLARISAIAQDGSVFNAPEEDELPEPLEIEFDSLASSVIVLKIPIGNLVVDVSLQNSITNSKFRAKRAIIASKTHDDANADILNELNDEDEYLLGSAFNQDKKSIVLASLKTKLGILGSKTPYELEIPICKIQNINSSKQIKLDDKFIPTCLDISKHSFIRQFIDEIIYATKQHKQTLSNIFKSIDQTKNTLDFATYLSLNMLKKWNIIFSHMASKQKIHPEYFYEKLLDFQTDLTALSNDEQFSEFITYNHDDLTSTFTILINNIRLLFSKILSPKYTMAHIVTNAHGFFDCIFDNSGIIENSELFLAVSSNAGSDYLLRNFKEQCKIHTQSSIKNIVASQLKGLNIEQISVIPTTLPKLNGYVYYKLDKNDKLFKAFAGENVISVYVTNNITKPDIRMWAVL